MRRISTGSSIFVKESLSSSLPLSNPIGLKNIPSKPIYLPNLAKKLGQRPKTLVPQSVNLTQKSRNEIKRQKHTQLSKQRELEVESILKMKKRLQKDKENYSDVVRTLREFKELGESINVPRRQRFSFQCNSQHKKYRQIWNDQSELFDRNSIIN